MVDGRRTVMAAGQAPLALRKSADDAAPASAYLRPRAIAALGRCKARLVRGERRRRARLGENCAGLGAGDAAALPLSRLALRLLGRNA